MPSPESEIPFDRRWQASQQAAERLLGRLKRRQRLPHRYSSRAWRQSRRDIQQLTARLSSLKFELEDYATSWQNLATPFWMAVRFGGLGIVIGWGLCWLTLGGTNRDRQSLQSLEAVPEAIVSIENLGAARKEPDDN